MDNVDCIVIGSGVVGLSIARQLCNNNIQCILVDSEASFGRGVSSRNSEVIHAGLYYPQDSLKSELCLKGKNLLYKYCNDKNIPFRKCGKLVVATSLFEEERLFELMESATNNGVLDLKLLSKIEVRKQEPNVISTAAIISPSTGIINSHQYMESMLYDFKERGGSFAPNSRVKKIYPTDNGFDVIFSINNNEYVIHTKFLINSGGLGAQKIANNIEGFPQSNIPNLYLCKGTYFSLSGLKPFNRLIYPLPPQKGDGLGVHSTFDLQGNVRFGPDAEYIENEDYEPQQDKLGDFIASISRYYPDIVNQKLHVDYCGIRPKLQGPHDGFADFQINNNSNIGFPGLIQLFGIESPGLTSSLAIAEKVELLISEI